MPSMFIKRGWLGRPGAAGESGQKEPRFDQYGRTVEGHKLALLLRGRPEVVAFGREERQHLSQGPSLSLESLPNMHLHEAIRHLRQCGAATAQDLALEAVHINEQHVGLAEPSAEIIQRNGADSLVPPIQKPVPLGAVEI